MVNDVGGQGRGTFRTNCWRNFSGLWDVRYIAFVVEGDEDGSGIMKSCFVVIVVNDVVGRVGGRSERTVRSTVAASWTASGTSGTFAMVVEGDEDGSGIMKSCFAVIVVKDMVGQGRRAIKTDCWRNCSSLWDVRYFAFVVEGDEDGSGIMKSCFVFIVVNYVAGQCQMGQSEPTFGGTVAASWMAFGTSRTSPVVVDGD